MKKLLAILLSLCFVLACFAGCEKKPGPDSSSSGGGGDNEGGLPAIFTDGTYSYRMGPSDLPTAWNVHTYKSDSSTYVLDYSSDALYTFDYNETGDAYQIVPSMASGDPVDVTADYVGRYGVAEGDENKVYSIPLKSNLKFDNGDAITADTFVESMKLLLAPEAANYRADNVYTSGNLKIYNAENYLKQGSYGYGEFVSANYGDDEYVDPSTFTLTDAGTYQHNGKDVTLNINDGGNWGDALSLYAEYGYLATGYEMDEATGRVKIFSVAGEWILTRSLNPHEFGADDSDYIFYDLEGNQLQRRYVNEEGTAWVYLDKDGNIVEAWAGCAPNTLNATYDPLAAAADEDGYVKLTPALLKNLQDTIAMLHSCANVEEYAAKKGDYAYMEFEEMAFLGGDYPALAYENNVGFFADGNNLVIVLINPMEDNFYLRYELCSSFFLVNPTAYKNCISNAAGVYANDYGTSVEKYVGFGPYKLTQYVADSTIILERNPHWHGYTAEEYVEGTYQTDRVVYTKVSNDATRREMFEKGELDSYGLQAEDMEDYISSPYTYYTDSESTWYIAMNPDFDNLATIQKDASPINPGNKVVKTVIAIEEFRQAMSWSLDREQFILALSPTSGIAKSLLSSMIVADPESGATYRSTDEGKDAILDFWGLSDAWGEGKEYATRDDAIASITGYDPTGAKALFQQAYNKAVADGHISEEDITSGKWEVQIVIGQPSAGNFYTKGFEFLKTNWTNAVVGTPFEGHVTFQFSQVLGSTTFGDYLRNGSVDLLFGVGYGGSMFNPYSMMDCFTGSLQYDLFTDKKSVDLDIELDLGDGAKLYRASLYDWVSQACQGNEITAYIVENGIATKDFVKLSAGTSDDPQLRLTILAKAEAKVMTLSNIFPLMTDASASLRGARIQYKTEEYVVGLGFGGIQYYTYAMDDAQFASYVASIGGVINYK